MHRSRGAVSAAVAYKHEWEEFSHCMTFRKRNKHYQKFQLFLYSDVYKCDIFMEVWFAMRLTFVVRSINNCLKVSSTS